jgi:hypothetical protein
MPIAAPLLLTALMPVAKERFTAKDLALTRIEDSQRVGIITVVVRGNLGCGEALAPPQPGIYCPAIDIF